MITRPSLATKATKSTATTLLPSPLLPKSLCSWFHKKVVQGGCSSNRMLKSPLGDWAAPAHVEFQATPRGFPPDYGSHG